MDSIGTGGCFYLRPAAGRFFRRDNRIYRMGNINHRGLSAAEPQPKKFYKTMNNPER